MADNEDTRRAVVQARMEERNRQQIIPPQPHDMTKYAEFLQSIGVAMPNNCPTTE